uniref:Uncharacterized protein n=1 Tax=Anguilla anguilla TaxID=7936 RepID=A0A0E9TMH6_ANGAN
MSPQVQRMGFRRNVNQCSAADKKSNLECVDMHSREEKKGNRQKCY